jgi:acetylornithine deacetylase/succinyl-diaminopimelate desuccinylase-like protein
LKRSAEMGFDMHFTRVEGGDTVNKVPDRASIQFYLTSHQFEDFKRFFREVVKTEDKERAFRVELGGVGDTGVRFLPDPLFPCLQEVAAFFRTIAGDFEDIEKHIQEGIKAIAIKYPALNITAVKERMNPGLNMTLNHDLVKICQEAMINAQIEPLLDKKATSTEAAQYFQAGYEAVVFGPGKSAGNSHSPNEHNILEHLEKATAFYERLIERACL